MAVSIDAQAAINEIARDLDRGVDGYRASAAPDPVTGFSSPSTQFGDDEFLHEISGYGMYDPALRAALSKFGAGIASYVTADKMIGKVGGKPPMGESVPLYSSGKFKTPLVRVRSDIKHKMDREFLNDVWRHEYRHMGLGLLRQTEEQTLMNKLDTYLSKQLGRPRYFSPLDTAMNKVFKPGYSWSGGLVPRPYGLGYAPGQSLSSEELTNRYMDFKYGLSDAYKGLIEEDTQKYEKAGYFDISSDNELRSLIERIQKQAEGL